MGRSTRRFALRRARPVLAAIALLAMLPAVVVAHPLGNFTINHYAEVRVEPDRVLLDVVIDQAEIPAFQARQEMDIDGDGQVSDAETSTAAVAACEDLAESLRLSVDGTRVGLTATHAGLSFPPGTGGLSTLRQVCGFTGPLATPLGADAPTDVTFADESFAERIGWREIVVTGSGVTVAAPGEAPALAATSLSATSVSERLTTYPDGMLQAPLAQTDVRFSAVAGGPVLAPLALVGAAPIPGVVIDRPAVEASPPAPVDGAATGALGGEALPDIFRTTEVTPLVLALAFLTAAALGAGHALTPGHGKALMAAYLVGTRGTWRHAIGLGLAVSLSHTVGILVLAAVVVGAADLLPPDVVVRVAPIVAAISILAIGGWMLLGEWRRRRGAEHGAHDHDHEADEDHGHGHEDNGHSHGGVRHSHAPAAGTTITWRGLFVLGLAGGLIPSTSALLILLGSIAAGRPGFGFVLVIAFGLGMAAVMGGIGLLTVAARDRLDHVPAAGTFARVREAVPMAAAVLVFGFGIYLTVQAFTAAPTL